MNKAPNKIWIYGKHAASAALSNKDRDIYKVLSTTEAIKQIAPLLKNRKLPHSLVTNKELDQRFKDATHQGVALEASTIFQHNIFNISNAFEKDKSLIVMLDRLTDPQNIGNIIRSADAFGADAVLAPKDHSFSETTIITKAACGALDRIPMILITNLVSELKMLKDKGYWIVGLDSHATQHLHDFKFTPKTVIVVGSEGAGLRELTRKHCDFLLKIAITQAAGSINAASACAIAMHGYACTP